MKNKKTKLLIGLLSMSVICMAGKSVNANRINWNDPVQKAQYYKEYYQKNRGLILPKKILSRTPRGNKRIPCRILSRQQRENKSKTSRMLSRQQRGKKSTTKSIPCEEKSRE